MLARLCCGQDGQGPPALQPGITVVRGSAAAAPAVPERRSNASRDEMVQIRDWACADGHASPIKPHPTTIHDAHRAAS
jgi:hypothetical protein